MNNIISVSDTSCKIILDYPLVSDSFSYVSL